MANEILHIENFAGIKNADIELSAMNVFIGPQASGKSVCAKLFFFFKQCLANLAYDITNYRTKSAISVAHKETFSRYFPLESWSEGKFVVRYVCGEM
jgi:predicted ATPase